MSGARLLAFVEDPGAANWLVALAPAMASAGLELDIRAAGTARAFLAERGVAARAANEVSTMAALNGVAALVVGTSENPATFGHRLVDVARAQGVPSVGLVDLAVNAEHRFRGLSDDPLKHVPDVLLVPDAASSDAFSALGVSPRRLVCVGQVHLEAVLATAQKKYGAGTDLRRIAAPDAPPDRPLWVFIAEIDYAFPQDDTAFTLAGRGGTRYRTAVVLEELLDAVKGLAAKPWLIVRLHPKSRLGEFDAYRGEIDGFSQSGDPLPLVLAADAVVGMTSMLVEEAAALGRPTLAILPRAAERAWLPALAGGTIPVATTRDEIRTHVAGLAARGGTAEAEDYTGAAARAVAAIGAVAATGRLPT